MSLTSRRFTPTRLAVTAIVVCLAGAAVASACPPATPATCAGGFETYPLVMCPERCLTTSAPVASPLPFATASDFPNGYRVQYVFTQETLEALRGAGICTIDSLQARALDGNTFTGAYGSNPVTGEESSIQIVEALSAQAVDCFDSNTSFASPYGAWSGSDADPIVVASEYDADCDCYVSSITTSYSSGPLTFSPISLLTPPPAVIVDMTLYPISATGAPGWEVTSGPGGCRWDRHASTLQPQRLWTAIDGVDGNPNTSASHRDGDAFVWVFTGVACNTVQPCK